MYLAIEKGKFAGIDVIGFTATQLLGSMDDGPTRADGSFKGAVEAAETVKFGRVRPDAQTAQSHWTAIRAWVAEVDHPRRPEEPVRTASNRPPRRLDAGRSETTDC